jgi:hypothetical protein
MTLHGRGAEDHFVKSEVNNRNTSAFMLDQGKLRPNVTRRLNL